MSNEVRDLSLLYWTDGAALFEGVTKSTKLTKAFSSFVSFATFVVGYLFVLRLV